MKKFLSLIAVTLASFTSPSFVFAARLGKRAPIFEAQTHTGEVFSLSDRQGKGWTVLFFYPKAETPGCTKQVCAFRDNLKELQSLGAEVFGISTNSVKEQAQFHRKEKLNFTLLADPKALVAEQYGTKMPLLKISKRWTFLIDTNLIIRHIDYDVDPVLDAKKIAEKIRELSP